jgi:hypothetical protein
MVAILIGILIPIPIGVGVNLVTPWVKTQLSTYNQARRQARIKKIQDQYLQIAAFREDRDTGRLVAIAAAAIINTTLFLAFTIIFILCSLYITDEYGLRATLWNSSISTAVPSARFMVSSVLIIAMISMAVAAAFFTSALRLFRNVSSKDESYEEKTKKTLLKLGSSLPSDIQPGLEKLTEPPDTMG